MALSNTVEAALSSGVVMHNHFTTTSQSLHEQQKTVNSLKKDILRSCQEQEFCLTKSVCHAIKEEPGVSFEAIFDKGNIMAGVDAEHSKQLHHASGHRIIRGHIFWYC